MSEELEWDWTIEAMNKGYFFFKMKCVPAFGGGRYTLEQTEIASEEFNKIDNPDVPRTREEARKLKSNLIAAILNHELNFHSTIKQ